MARYFFHVIDGKFLVDDEGTECVNLADVRQQAIAAAGAILKDFAGQYPSGLEWQMHVTDAEHTAVFKLRFSMEEFGPAPPPKLKIVGA